MGNNIQRSKYLQRKYLVVSAALLIIGIAIVLAFSHRENIAICGEGMTALSGRCCGVGQSLQNNACTGIPTHCAPGLIVSPDGCIAVPHVVGFTGGPFRLIPSDWESVDRSIHIETNLSPFRIDAFEVSYRQYNTCIHKKDCFSVSEYVDSNLPVSDIDFFTAEHFCKTNGGKIPRCAELAFVASANGTRRYPWGNTGAVCRRAAWGLDTGPCAISAGPHIIGSHPEGATPEGVHDLAGNVSEWCTNDSNTIAAFGGNWTDVAASRLRAWNIREISPHTKSNQIGFRCTYDTEP